MYNKKLALTISSCDLIKNSGFAELKTRVKQGIYRTYSNIHVCIKQVFLFSIVQFKEYK